MIAWYTRCIMSAGADNNGKTWVRHGIQLCEQWSVQDECKILLRKINEIFGIETD